LLSYLRVLANPADAISLERMVGYTAARKLARSPFEGDHRAWPRVSESRHSEGDGAGSRPTPKVALRIAKQAGDALFVGCMILAAARLPEFEACAELSRRSWPHSGFEP